MHVTATFNIRAGNTTRARNPKYKHSVHQYQDAADGRTNTSDVMRGVRDSWFVSEV